MELAPISNLILQSMQSQGLPLQHDMFTSGNNPHGCGHAPRTVYKGMRTTAADFLKVERPNLMVLVETTVDKIIMEQKGDQKVATAVRVITKDGNSHDIHANHEIVVSGGAYCSPAILMRSGIGAKSELEQLGIECMVDLPGVGKNLLDHLVGILRQHRYYLY
jgi:choline dehydrogenase-like flavoprotein